MDLNCDQFNSNAGNMPPSFATKSCFPNSVRATSLQPSVSTTNNVWWRNTKSTKKHSPKRRQFIREDLLTNDEIFDCNTSFEKQLQCIPSNLLLMLQLIFSGAPSEEGSDKQIDNIVLCIAQLIRYNALKNKRDPNANIVRHRADNEPPFPTVLGMLVHATTRSKTMLEYLNWHGLTPWYQREKCIRGSIANQICNSYKELGYVCPPTSSIYIHTIDNIDHNFPPPLQNNHSTVELSRFNKTQIFQ